MRMLARSSFQFQILGKKGTSLLILNAPPMKSTVKYKLQGNINIDPGICTEIAERHYTDCLRSVCTRLKVKSFSGI